MFAAASLAAGVGFIALALWMRLRSRQSRSWPSVEGVVLESRVDDRHLETMKPVLRYRYVVAGREYVGHRVAYAGYGISRRAMADLVAPYPAGQVVRVHYDPRDPARAVLDPRGASDWWYWLLAGVAFCGLYAWLLQG